ncbi:MAG: DUF58 domain-containing protein [Polyangiales bacterium]|nr:DUF58 domain-containing protein [Myxococcales bacterium]
MNAPSTALDADVAARLSNLQVRVRRAVDGFLSGLHRSPHRGASVVFVEHEEYRPGDDLRRIDWRATARRERTVLKRFEQESSLKAWLLVDASGSMQFRGAVAEESKYEHAATLAAALAHLLLRQSDTVALSVVDSAVRHFVPPRGIASQFTAVEEALAAPTPAGSRTDLGPVFEEVIERAGKRALVVLVSDLVDVPMRILQSLQHFVARGHDVWVLQVLSRDELTFPFRGPTRFHGLEGQGTLDVDADAARAKYLSALEAWRGEISATLAGVGARHLLCATDEPAERHLAALLTAQSRGRARG